MAERLFELEWIKRVQQSRAVKVTESGQRELRKWLGLELKI
jgi:hypothetical protein